VKFLSFEYAGKASYGVLQGEAVIDIGASIGARFPTLRSLIAAAALDEARSALQRADAAIPLNQIKFLPPIPEPGKILAIGLNYAAHAAEGGSQTTKTPIVFTRFADSLVGHDQPILKPRESESYDWEAELGVIIGKPARRVSEESAYEHVAGYTVMNEGSVRDWQRHTTQIIPGKNFFHSGAAGPWMVTADEVPDPTQLRVILDLNGTRMQDGRTSSFIFSIPKLIAYISTFTPLGPGDMIATGTPAGVGVSRNPPVFLKPGDRVEVSIEQVGTLRNVVAED
jgi:2-keto-4-pentenoate hydratase/2-oxohepta-3-ene-1,7-dioic acid hydratase in catechol pathway